MPRVRTINEAAAYFRELDPETALTKTAIRRLIVTGTIPAAKIGRKYLVSIEAIESYLSGSQAAEKNTERGVIHPVAV